MNQNTILKRFGLLMTAATLLLGASPLHAGQGPQPPICTRACWAARAPTCGITQMSSLSRAIIHHTAGASDYSTDLETSKAKMRAVQNLHINNGWCDIAYHFLVDAGGNVFEGRSGAMSGLPRGTHDAVNANSFGFTMLGYFHPPYNHNPNPTMRNRLYDVIAWRMPSGWSPYGAGSYGGGTVGYLDGHRKASSTACPGDGFHPVYITENYNGGEARNSVNAKKNGSVGGVAHENLGVLYNDGLFSAKEGAWGSWFNQLGSVSSIQMNGRRLGALANGAVYVKEGLQGGWTTQTGAGANRFQLHGDRIAILYNNGILSAKDGLYSGWFDQMDQVSNFQLEGNRIAALRLGVLYVKEGLQGGWTTQTGPGVVNFQLSGNRISVLYSDGLFSAKDGLYGAWYNQLGGVSSFSINGDRIGIVAGGTVYVKEGLQGAWTTQTGSGFAQVKVYGNRIGALATDGTLIVKDGLYGSWFNQIGGVTQFEFDGDRIGVLAGGMVTIKYGLQGGWINQTGPNTCSTFQLTTWTE